MVMTEPSGAAERAYTQLKSWANPTWVSLGQLPHLSESPFPYPSGELNISHFLEL